MTESVFNKEAVRLLESDSLSFCKDTADARGLLCVVDGLRL